MIRYNRPVVWRQRFNQFPEIERPGRVTMDHHNRVTFTFIEIMILKAVYIQVMGGERIEVSET